MKNKIIIALFLASLSSIAFGQATTLADVANALIPQVADTSMLFSAIAYVCGIGLTIKGVLKLKEFNETKGRDVKMQTPIMLIIAGAMLLALPSFINIGVTTFGFDKGGQQTFKY